MVQIDRTRRNPRRSTRSTQKPEDVEGKRLMAFATGVDEEDQFQSNSNISIKKKATEVRENDEVEDDEMIGDGLSDSEEDDDQDISSRPWLRGKNIAKTSNVSSGNKSKSNTDIPLKKKRKANEDGETSSSTKTALKKQKDNEESKATTSLIANMAPVTQKKATVRDWQSNEDYFKSKQQSSSTATSGRNKTKDKPKSVNSSSNQNGAQKEVMNKNKLKSPTTRVSNSTISYQQNNIQKSIATPASASLSNNNNEKARREITDKITKDLGVLIEKVIEAKGKVSSMSSSIKSSETSTIDELLKQKFDQQPSSISTDSNEIDWNASFIPKTDESINDFFVRDDKGRVLDNISLDNQIPMFPEDFKRGKKEWPLKWWGIIPAPEEILFLHDKQRPRSRSRGRSSGKGHSSRSGRSSSERRSGRSRSSDRRGDRDRIRDRDRGRDKDRDRDRDRDREWERERDRYDQQFQGFPQRGGGPPSDGRGPGFSGGPPPNFVNYPPHHFDGRFPPSNQGGGGGGNGPPTGWPLGRMQEDGWYDRGLPEGTGGRGFRGGRGPIGGRGGGPPGQGWGPPGNSGWGDAPPRRRG